MKRHFYALFLLLIFSTVCFANSNIVKMPLRSDLVDVKGNLTDGKGYRTSAANFINTSRSDGDELGEDKQPHSLFGRHKQRGMGGWNGSNGIAYKWIDLCLVNRPFNGNAHTCSGDRNL